MIEASSTARNTFNPIRNIVDKIRFEPNPEKPSISLSLGDPTVFGNLQTAKEVKDAMKKVLDSNGADGYAPSVGTESARTAIAQRYINRFSVNYTPQDIVIASGCSGALDLAISVLCGPGDSLLIPQPGFTLYETLTGSKGIKAVHYPLDADKNWEIKLEEVEKLMKGRKIKAWIINNPSNPCGSVYSKQHLIECIKDEIYEDMVFSGNKYVPIARLCQESVELNVPVLTCSGLAKRFLVPGWRVGWVAVNEAPSSNLSDVRKGLFDLSTLLIGSCTLIQAALPEIFEKTPESFYTDINRVFEQNAAYLSRELSAIRGLKVVKPQGTLYMLVGIDFDQFSRFKNDIELSELLLAEQSISVLPGSIFGMKGYVRLVYAAPMEVLTEFVGRIKIFFEKHHHQ